MSPCRRPITILAALLAVLSAWASTAHAEADESIWSTGVELLTFSHARPEGTVTRFAPLIEASYRYALDDFWELGGTVALGAGLGSSYDAEAVGRATFECRYVIDALTWVPYLSLGAGVLFRSEGPQGWDGGSTPALDLTGHLGAGVEWRPARDWSMGVGFRYHATLTDLSDTVGPVELGTTMSWYFD